MSNRVDGREPNFEWRTLKSQGAMALRQSLRTIGIGFKDGHEVLRVNVLLEFEGNTSELEKLGVNLRTKVGSIYRLTCPLKNWNKSEKLKG